MRPRIEKGAKREFWATEPEGLSLARPCDRLSAAAATVALIATVAFLLYSSASSSMSVRDAAPWLSSPFIASGVTYYLRKRFWLLAAPAAIAAALWLLGVPPNLVVLALVVMVGAPGMASLVEAMQRWMFYRVLRSIEYYNVKESHTMFERAVAFVFKIPEDLDTRNITIDCEARRRRIPWRDMGGTISLGLVVGMFVWIYISMNPAIMDLSGEMDADNILSVHFLIFSLILYIPVMVLPWSVFRSLNARVETHHRDYRVYNGVVSTVKTMAVPIVAAFLLVFSAIGSSGYLSVLYYLGLSAAMVAAIVASSSLLYYLAFESAIISDIASRWAEFRPVPVFARLDRAGEPQAPVPGTPKRDESDFGGMRLGG